MLVPEFHEWNHLGDAPGAPIRMLDTFGMTGSKVCLQCCSSMSEHGILSRIQGEITLAELSVCPGSFVVNLGDGEWSVCCREIGVSIHNLLLGYRSPYRIPAFEREAPIDARLKAVLDKEWPAELDEGVRGASKESPTEKAIRLIREYKDVRLAVSRLVQTIRIV